MFGISGGEFFVILVVAALVLGPRNIAQANATLRKGIAKAREYSARLRTETTLDVSALGIDPADLEAIKNFKASSLDPRAMIREAVREEMQAWAEATSGLGLENGPAAQPTVPEPAPNVQVEQPPTLHTYLQNQGQGEPQ